MEYLKKERGMAKGKAKAKVVFLGDFFNNLQKNLTDNQLSKRKGRTKTYV